MEIVIVVGIIILLFLLFSSSKKSPKETPEIKAYQAIAKHQNPNQEELIQKVFSLAEKDGGLWRVSFTSTDVTIYEKNGTQKYLSLSELGYGELSLHKYITFQNRTYQEFPYRLKRAAESRGYLYWTEKGQGFTQSDSYTSYDDGHSYSRDGSVGTFNKSVNVCSNEYYKIYKPYPNPNLPPLKQL